MVERNVFITGSTGFIGGELCFDLLREGYSVTALVRASNYEEAQKRAMIRLKGIDEISKSRLSIVCGDMQAIGMGLDSAARLKLSRTCNYVLHCAGETRFNKPSKSYDVNITGVENLVGEVSGWASCPRIYHMSTASINGSPDNSILCEDDVSSGYMNGYVASKQKAEEICFQSDLDIICLRPSVVVARGRRTRRFAKEILWFFSVAHELGVIPLKDTAMFDIVSVDYVSRVVIELMKKPKNEYTCYHISAGVEHSVNCQECYEVSEGYYGSKVSFISLEEWESLKQSHLKSALMKLMDFYIPFINANIVYSNERIANELGTSMPSCHRLSDYLSDNLSTITKDEAMAEAAFP